MRSGKLTLCVMLALCGCANRHATTGATVVVDEPVVSDEPSADWRRVARPTDVARLATLVDRFAAAAPRTGAIVALKAGITTNWPTPTPGVYRCRIHRLPVEGTTRTFPPFFCYVQSDGAFMTFAKGTGSERPAGRLWADGSDRHVFLGAAPHLAGESAPAYGADPSTDRIGMVERIGEFRWRLIVDEPQPDIRFDVIEFWPDSIALAAAAPR